MAKFCTDCGKPLEEGGVCDCMSAPQPEAAPQQAYAQSQSATATIAQNAYVKQTKQAVGQFTPFVKSYFRDPAGATLEALRGKNIALSLVMMCLSALMSGLMFWTTMSKGFGALRGILKEMVGRVPVEVPFFSTFFAGFAMALVGLALSALALYVLLRLVKINSSFQYVLIAVGLNSVLCTGFTAASWVLMLVGLPTVSFVILALGVVLWCALGVLVAVKVFGAKFHGILALLYTAFFAVTLCLSLWLGGKLVVGAIGAVKIDDKKLSDAIEDLKDEMQNIDTQDILDGIGNMVASGYYNDF